MRYLNKSYQKQYWETNTNARDYKHPVVKFFVNQRINWINSHIDLSKIKSAYDVGCGDGFATYYINKKVKKVRGGDISSEMLRKNPLSDKYLDIIDAEDLPLKNNSYDMVYTWEVLHHLPNPEKAIREMARVSKKYVVIFEPNRTNPLQFLFGLLVKQERGTLKSSRKNIINMINKCGLSVVAAEYVGKIPPNKTPEKLLPFMTKLRFKSNLLSGISIGVVAEKLPK